MLRLQGHDGRIHALAFTPAGDALLSAGADGTIRVWDMTGAERCQLATGGAPVLCLAVHPNGRALASGSADGTLCLWDLAARRLIESEPGQMAGVTGVAWAGGRTTLWTTCGARSRPDKAGELRQWNFDGAVPAPHRQVEAEGLWALAAARHAPVIAWGGGAKAVVAWDVTRQGRKLFRQPKSSLAVALSDDGRTLASALDRAVKVWDVESGRERATLEGHVGLVRALAFAPGGALLASGGQDQAVRFWRVGPPGVERGPAYQWPIGGVHALAFAPDGQTAAAGGDRGEIWVWDVEE